MAQRLSTPINIACKPPKSGASVRAERLRRAFQEGGRVDSEPSLLPVMPGGPVRGWASGSRAATPQSAQRQHPSARRPPSSRRCEAPEIAYGAFREACLYDSTLREVCPPPPARPGQGREVAWLPRCPGCLRQQVQGGAPATRPSGGRRGVFLFSPHATPATLATLPVSSCIYCTYYTSSDATLLPTLATLPNLPPPRFPAPAGAGRSACGALFRRAAGWILNRPSCR